MKEKYPKLTRVEIIRALRAGNTEKAVLVNAALLLESDGMVVSELKLRLSGLRRRNKQLAAQLEQGGTKCAGV